MASARNPLYAPQREKSGSRTLGKYHFQYNWALYKAASLIEKKEEFVIIVECHEDVVISDSMDGAKAMFDFFQVKETDKGFSISDIKKCPKGKDSILSKLLSSYMRAELKDKLKSINLVSSNGFRFKSKDETDLTIYRVDDLKEKDKKSINIAISKILKDTPLTIDLNLCVSELSPRNDEEIIKGRLSEVIESLFPKSQYNIGDIYRVLRDDLFKKGTNSFDFKEWDEFIDAKALTSNNVFDVLTQFTSSDDIQISKFIDELLKELYPSTIYRTKCRKRLEQYVTRISCPTVEILQFRKMVQSLSSDIIQNDEDTRSIINSLKDSLNEVVSQLFASDSEFEAALIYELSIILNK